MRQNKNRTRHSQEIQFDIDNSIYRLYRNLKPVNWAGPDAVWVKPVSRSWIRKRSHPGIGLDGPDDGNVYTSNDLVAYYDSPGLNPFREGGGSGVSDIQGARGPGSGLSLYSDVDLMY